MATSAVIPQQAGAGGAVPVSTLQKPTTSSAANATAIPTVTNPLATAAANPYAATTATTPTTGTGSVPMATTSTGVQTNGINWADGSNTVTGDFKDTYGAGTGTAISQVLQGLGTTTDSAVQATIANTDQAAAKQYANIQSGEAAAGVTANSSTAALAGGDFYSGVNANLQQEIGGMELNEENTLLSTLTNEGSAHGTDSSTLDNIMNGIGDVGSLVPGLATGASALTSAFNPNADTGILDAIGGI